MNVLQMRKVTNKTDSKTLAHFDVQTDDGITLKGFRIINGPKGLFVSVPSEKGKDGKYYESVILPKEMKKELDEIALEEYEKE